MKEFDQTLMQLTMALTKTARVYKAAADKMAADFGLSQASAWPVVMIGRMGDGIRPSALAERLDIEHSSLVRIIDQLIDVGLIERRNDDNDRRAKLLYLTGEGRRRSQELEQALIPFRRNLFKGIAKDDIAACKRVLDVLQLAVIAFAQSER
jgi:MarR family transcriptional regulator for hemolysin